MNEIVLYKKRNFSSLGVLVESTNDLANLVNEEGKIIKIDKNQILYNSNIRSEKHPNLEEVKLEIRSYRKHLEDNKSSIDLNTIWECSYDKNNRLPISLDDIIDLYPDYKNDKNKMFLLVWSLERDEIYFTKDGSGYLPNKPEEIEGIRRKKEDELLKIKERKSAKDWVNKVYNKELEHDDESIKRHCKYIDLIKEFAIFGEDWDRYKEAKSFIAEAGLKDEYSALEFLIHIGLWDKEDDPLLIRYGIKNRYPSKVLDETKILLEKETSFDKLVDISKLKVYSIDDDNTSDIDDALSIEKVGSNYRVGIHIANVARNIDDKSNLDKEAMKRGESIYMPEGNVHMFPPELTDNLLSLNEKKFRKAISLFVTFDQDNNIFHHEFMQTKVKITKNINYDDANSMIENSSDWQKLFEISNDLRLKRINSGAIIIQLPTLKISVPDSNNIVINKNYMNTPAHRMVAEYMILMNTISAKYFLENNIPALYRNQIEIISNDINDLDRDDELFPIAIIKYLKPTRISTKPEIHRLLGVNEYVQISSPIRRYLDLVMQRQLLSSLEGRRPLYKTNRLEMINAKTETTIREKKMIEKSRERFWVLKYLEHNNIKHLNGIISSVRNKRATAYFPEYLIEAPFSIVSEEQMEIGNTLRFAIENIDLIRKKITIKPA